MVKNESFLGVASVDTSVAFLPPHTLIYNPSWKSWKEGEEK